MKKFFPFLVLLIVFGLLCFSSCSKNDGEDTIQVPPSSESDVLGKSGLIFNSLKIQNNSASTSVPNSTETFSFLEEISFPHRNSLTSVTIGSGVTSIGGNAFYGCDSLTSIKFEDTSTWYYTNNYDYWQNKTGGTRTNVTNSSTNATYFDQTFCNDYWYKL